MDCRTSLSKIVNRCLKIGINCIAVADHGTITGALKLKEIAPFQVIVAEEILTPSGELMGLFLKEKIPSGLPPGETITRIRSQGGLVAIPHPLGQTPFSSLRTKQNNLARSETIVSQVDIIEVFNSRTLLPNSSTKAWELVNKYGLAASAGSDAHTPGEIGNAYVEMPEFNNPDDFVHCLSQGKIFGQRSNPFVYFATAWARIANNFGGRANPC